MGWQQNGLKGSMEKFWKKTTPYLPYVSFIVKEHLYRKLEDFLQMSDAQRDFDWGVIVLTLCIPFNPNNALARSYMAAE